jgi:hypothetical protein
MTSTNVKCTFCGDEGNWGRFGSISALYRAAGGYHGYERVAWICMHCRVAFGLEEVPPHWLRVDDDFSRKLLKSLQSRVCAYRETRL